MQAKPLPRPGEPPRARGSACSTLHSHSPEKQSLPPIAREADASRINAVLNHESVRPWVTLPGQADLDLSNFVADRRNVLLMTEGGSGGILFEQYEPGVYEAHTSFLPEARGPGALAAVRSMIACMFLTTDCMELVTRCPVTNRPAEALAKAVGGTLEFERPAAWLTESGAVAVRYYALRYPEWVRSAEILSALGEMFHARLEAENGRLRIADDLHEDDPIHDRHVGAAVAMMRLGQPAKGIVLYNRWARLAGCGLASIASLDPLVIDIGSHVLRVQPDNPDFEVIQCRLAQ